MRWSKIEIEKGQGDPEMRKEQQRFYDSVSSVKCTAGYNTLNTFDEYKLMLCESTVASYISDLTAL